MTKLIADIGGTNARFAIVENGTISGVKVLACNDYETPAAAARAYLADTGKTPSRAAFAVATPLDGSDQVVMTNHVWDFSISRTANDIGVPQLKVINDFAALAHAVPTLTSDDYYQLGGETAQKNMPVGIIGPGTGLGVAGIVFDTDGRPIPLSTEGGHVTMPVGNAREFELFAFLKIQKYRHISAERVCSGKGLVNLYNAIAGVDNLDLPEKSPAEITEAALDSSCRASAEALDLFCHFLGVTAGNLALSYGAMGGIFIAGGIVPQLGDYFKSSRFRESFVAKGRFRGYLERIPVFVITHPYPGLEGLKNIA